MCTRQGRLSSTWLMHIDISLYSPSDTLKHIFSSAISCSHIKVAIHIFPSVSVKHTHMHTKPQSGPLKPRFLAGLSERLRGFRLYKTDRFRLPPSFTFSLSLSLPLSFQAYCKAWCTTVTCEADQAAREKSRNDEGIEGIGEKSKVIMEKRKGENK